ncbi:hypothetical protein C8Q75DRAFT_803108 [Abortiporus biennis]|nr:hypothetical protein C8Q75DRAFT_803108 [Abortiporus biennis]
MSSTIYPQPRVFPQEIFDLIIDFCSQLPVVEDDNTYHWPPWDARRGPRSTTLHACSLTCRSWTFRSRLYLFPTIHIHRNGEFSRLITALRNARHLANRTETLMLHNGSVEEQSSILSSSVTNLSDDRIGINMILRKAFRTLPHLTALEIRFMPSTYHSSIPTYCTGFKLVRRLTLHATDFINFHNFRRFVSAFPSLAVLSLTRVKWDVGPLSIILFASMNKIPRSQSLSLAHIRLSEIDVSTVTSLLAWVVTTQSIQFMRQFSLFVELPTLTLETSETICSFFRNSTSLVFTHVPYSVFEYLVLNNGFEMLQHEQVLSVDFIDVANTSSFATLLSQTQFKKGIQSLSLSFVTTKWEPDYSSWNTLDNVFASKPYEKVLVAITFQITPPRVDSIEHDEKMEKEEIIKMLPKSAAKLQYWRFDWM